MEVQVLSSAQTNNEVMSPEEGLGPKVGSGGLGVLPWRKLFKTVGFESAVSDNERAVKFLSKLPGKFL